MGTIKKTIFVLGSCIMFVLFFVLLLIPLKSSGLVLNEGQVVAQDGQTEKIVFPFIAPFDLENKATFTFHFSNTDGDSLVIRRPSANALEVYLNGERIYRLGDMENPTSNLWNNILTVPLLGHLQADNVLEIKMASTSYGVGLSLPPYIENYKITNTRLFLSNLVNHDILCFSIGAALIVGLILLVLSISREPKFQGEFFLGLASIMSAVFCIDYTFRLTTGSVAEFLWAKKVMMTAGYLAALFFLIGMELYLARKLKFGKVMIYITVVSVLLIFAAWNLVVLNNMLISLNVVLLVNIAGTVIVLIKNQQQKPWMIIPAVLLTLSMVQMVVLTALNISLPFVAQYVILVSTVVFGVSMINVYNQLYRDNSELEQKANRDPLTGVYNRNILYKISPHPHDVLVIMDIDNLKIYNDQFGHPEGDQLLISLTDTVCSNLRQTDLVIRYGGDEFVLILRDTTIEVTERIMQRIRNQFIQKKSNDWMSFSYGIEPVGETFSDTLIRADEILYSMKNGRKEDKTLARNSIAV